MQNNRAPNRSETYEIFVQWNAMTYLEKREFGVLDQTEFCQKYEVNKDTLTRWKQRPDFQPKVKQHTNMWASARTADIYHAIYQSALKGNASSQRLWMRLFKGFPEKKDKNEHPHVVLPVDDIRHIIGMLPEYRKKVYWNLVRDLLYDATLFNKLEEEGRTMTEEEYIEYHKDGL